jgi:VWFA-related protein
VNIYMYRIIYYFLFCLILTSFAGAFGSGQDEAEVNAEDPIQVEVHLVNIEARVSENGEPIRDLTRDDFILKEGGEEQEIAFFYYVDAPASLEPEIERPGKNSPSPELPEDNNVSGIDAESIPATESVAEESLDPSWIHLVTEAADPVEFKRTAAAIRKFVQEEMQPGFYVSLGGMPFTDNREILLSTLDRMEGKPFGSGSGIDPSLIHVQDLEIMRDIALSIPFAPDIESIEDALQTTAVFDGPIDRAPVIGVETVNRQIRFFGELALMRYMDLVERMALLPGRKSIVVFRNGLRLDHETTPVLDRLLSMAARNRVSFYTVDSLGLDVISPVKDYRYPMAWSRGRLENYLPDPMKETTRRREAEEGLVVLARETGGYAVLDNNNLGSIFTKVAEDAFSYYVLGYYPENFTNGGRFRKIKVSLKDDRDYDITAIRGYSEPKKLRLQSRAERLVSLRKTLQSSGSGDLNVQVEPEVFAAPDGSPVLFVSAGVPVREFDLKKGTKQSRVEGEILIQIVNSFSQKIPLYHSGRIKERFDNSRLHDKDGPFINYQTVLPLSPGLYEIKVIIRDSRSGKHGMKSSSFLVQDFHSDSVPSSLLMTRYITSGSKVKKDSDDWHGRILSAGETGFYPQPDPEFRQGEIVHVLYHLYHPTAEDREWAKKGMQIGIYIDDAPVSGVAAFGQAFIDCEEDVIRYSAMIDTSTLGPGEYSFFALLPNYKQRNIPHLEEDFLVVGQ